jgi:hypothetical protein
VHHRIYFSSCNALAKSHISINITTKNKSYAIKSNINQNLIVTLNPNWHRLNNKNRIIWRTKAPPFQFQNWIIWSTIVSPFQFQNNCPFQKLQTQSPGLALTLTIQTEPKHILEKILDDLYDIVLEVTMYFIPKKKDFASNQIEFYR